MPDLGESKRVPLSSIFSGEATEFTPWLSSNLDRLANELSFELEPEETEVSVGAFKADIQARTTDGRVVVIVSLYMSDTYGFALPPAQRAMFEKWHKLDPPDEWEKLRDRRIEAAQGNKNPWVWK